MSVSSRSIAKYSLQRAEPRQDFIASRKHVIPDFVVQRTPVRIHRHKQGAKSADAESPQTFWIELFEIDILDRFDPRGLQSRGAARYGKISAADFAERIETLEAHAALADDDPHTFALHQRAREPLHPHRCRGADADRRKLRGIFRRRLDRPDVWGSVHDAMPRKIEICA